MSNIADDVPVYPCYTDSIENCIKIASLMGAILWGFLYGRRRWQLCQENHSARAVTQVVAAFLTGLTVRNTGRLCGMSTTDTGDLPTATRSTAGLGNESVTAMLLRTLCVRCV